jgi:hypothetical protein
VKLGAGFAAGLLVLAALGCQTAPPRDADPFAVGRAIPIDDPRVAARIRDLTTQARDRRSLVAAATLSLDGPQLNLSRPQRLAVRRPASLRVEILGLFGQVAAILVTDGATYLLWEASSGETSGGEVTRELLWDVAQVDLTAAEAARLLLGDPSAGEGALAVDAVESPDGHIAISFRGQGDGGARTIDFDRYGRVARALRYDDAGVLLWDASFSDYRDVSGHSLAHAVAIEFPRFDARARFQLERAELNRQLPNAVFTLPIR